MADLGILKVQIVPDMGDFKGKVSQAMGSVGSVMANVTGQVARDLTSIGASVVTAGSIGLATMATVGIKMAASLETAELQFQTLLGSAEEAKAKVADLFEFAKKTPFESGPIIEASRRLQVFGGDALNTMENLELVGDAAAATSAPIEEVAFWIGRAFSQIKGGQKFGEAAMRLQELGVLTPEVRTAMEDLSEAGGEADEVFGLLQGQLEQFNGAMELQADTLTGLTSTIKDQFAIGMAEAFRPVFEGLKDGLKVFREFGESDPFEAIISNMAGLSQIAVGVLQPAFDSLGDALEGLTTTEVDQFFADVWEQARKVAKAGGEIYDVFAPLAPIIGGVAFAFLSLKASAIPLVGLLFPQVTGLTGALLGFTLGIKENRDALATFSQNVANAAREGLPKLQGAIDTISTALTETFVGALDAITPAIEYLATSLIPTLADVFADVVPPLGEVVTALADLASGAITTIGPTIEAIAIAVGALLAAGLSILADLLGVVADNAGLVVPALVGIAAAIKVMKFGQAMGGIRSFADAMTGIQLQIGTFATAIKTKLGGAASSAGSSLGLGAGLTGTLLGLGAGLAVTVGVGLLTQHFAAPGAAGQGSR